MNEKLTTIKELADELGVSKNKIHYQVSKLSNEYIIRDNGMKLLTSTAVREIKKKLGIELNSKLNSFEHLENVDEPPKLDGSPIESNSVLNSYLNSLKHQIKYLESQTENKDEQIKSLVEAQKEIQKLLDQQQQLTLQANKQIEKLQDQLTLGFTKNEKTPPTPEEKSAEELDPIETKKWYQFWK